MTVKEFRSWIAFTQTSAQIWVMDAIQAHNNQLMLFYRGGENGRYVMVDKTGKFSMGIYEGAIPHIGEACFKVLYEKQFPTKQDALSNLLEIGGYDFQQAVRNANRQIKDALLSAA